jgi:hypothetical protein
MNNQKEILEKQQNILFRVFLLLTLLLPGCVSFPIPPTGEDLGKYGRIEIRITYVPNMQTMIDRFRSSRQTSGFKK